MLEENSTSRKRARLYAIVGVLLVSAALLGQGLVIFPQASAAPKDRIDPVVSITSPADGATVVSQTALIWVQGTAYDDIRGSGVKVVEVRVDNGLYVSATPRAPGDWSSWTAIVNVGSSGNHRITPRVTDNVGHQAWNSIHINLIVDSTAPSVVIATPANGVTLLPSTTLQVQGSSADNSGGSGIKTIQVRLDSGSYVTALPKTAGDWTSWTTSFGTLATGSHAIHAKAIDKAGNYRETSISIVESNPIVADTVPPTVSITLPAANSAITTSSGELMVTGKASDSGSGVKIVDVRVDDGTYVTATPKSSGDWSIWTVTLPITAGQHRLVSRAIDYTGNQAWNSIYVTIVEPSPDSSTTLDKFGIKKVYPTASGGNEWYVNMDDPKSDSMFRNLPSMTKQPDGSWQVSASQVRMEAWSPDNEKWLNAEITGYAKMEIGTNELIQWYSRGGHHTSTNPCLGSAYKARLYGDGEAKWVKEVTHPAYTGSHGTVQATTTPLVDRWIGFKAVIYNFVENGKTYVRMESYIDDDVTDSNGNLVIGNNWKLASVVEDRGGWATSNTDFDASCFPVNKDSTQQYRQRDEIINMPGGTSAQNIAAWRSDGLTWDWKYLSAREIVPPS